MGVTYEVAAYNTATDSANKIHDDGVAQQYGFRGGLVPGVDVYAYLIRAAVETFGPEWLRSGGIRARFHHPVYDGDTVTVTGTPTDDGGLDLVVADPAGVACARGHAVATPVPIERPLPATAPLPAAPPPASAQALAVGTVLGSVSDVFDASAALRYLADVRETRPEFRTGADGALVAHPGWLLRFANTILARNVVLGPWIHVESDVRLLGLVTPGQTVTARAVVLDEFERKGHRFVTLDVAVDADGTPVERVTHTAIHTARRVA